MIQEREATDLKQANQAMKDEAESELSELKL